MNDEWPKKGFSTFVNSGGLGSVSAIYNALNIGLGLDPEDHQKVWSNSPYLSP